MNDGLNPNTVRTGTVGHAGIRTHQVESTKRMVDRGFAAFCKRRGIIEVDFNYRALQNASVHEAEAKKRNR